MAESQLQLSNSEMVSGASSNLEAWTGLPFCKISQNYWHFSNNKPRGLRMCWQGIYQISSESTNAWNYIYVFKWSKIQNECYTVEINLISSKEDARSYYLWMYFTVLMRGLQSLQSSSVSASQNATARNGTKKGRQPYESENKSYKWVRKKLNALNRVKSSKEKNP